MNAIIGRKLGMTQLFAEDGTQVPVTVIEAGPCPVVQVRPTDGGGATRVQLGFETKPAKRAPKAETRHAAKAGIEGTPRVLREFACAGEVPAPGAVVTVAAFQPGDTVKMTVKLIAPVAMEEKMRFAIREGGKTVGAGVVTKIIK